MERTFEPTERKLRKATADGDVAKSRWLTATVILTIGFLDLFVFQFGISEFRQLAAESWGNPADFASENMLDFLDRVSGVLLILLGPFFLAVFLAALGSEAFQAGLRFSAKSISLRFDRLNVFTGLKKIFIGQDAGGPGFVHEFWKITLALTLMGSISWGEISPFVAEVRTTDLGSIPQAEIELLFSSLLLRLAAKGVCCAGILGFAELLFSRHQRRKRLRMDLEELKRELREAEGDPLLKSLRKHFAREWLLQGFLQGIRGAKVVVLSGQARTKSSESRQPSSHSFNH